jgi:hypothetical protein
MVAALHRRGGCKDLPNEVEGKVGDVGGEATGGRRRRDVGAGRGRERAGGAGVVRGVAGEELDCELATDFSFAGWGGTVGAWERRRRKATTGRGEIRPWLCR